MKIDVDSFNNPTWQSKSACIGYDPGVFIIGSPGYNRKIALEVCASCPVRVKCLEWILAIESDPSVDGTTGIVGIVAGVLPAERRRMRQCGRKTCTKIRVKTKKSSKYCSEECHSAQIAENKKHYVKWESTKFQHHMYRAGEYYMNGTTRHA